MAAAGRGRYLWCVSRQRGEFRAQRIRADFADEKFLRAAVINEEQGGGGLNACRVDERTFTPIGHVHIEQGD